MPKRSTKSFAPSGLKFDHCFYSTEDLDRVIKAVGGLPPGNIDRERPTADGSAYIVVSVDRRDALVERLETAATRWDVVSQFQSKPTPKQRADAFKEIEEAANALIRRLYLLEKKTESPKQPESEDELAGMPSAIRYDGGLQAYAATDDEYDSDRLREAVRGIFQLRDWAGAAKSRCESMGKTPRDSRHGGDAALDKLFSSLVGIYVDIFEKEIGTSISSATSLKPRQPTGPLVGFLRECLKPLLKDEMPSDEGIRERIRRCFQGRHKSKPRKP